MFQFFSTNKNNNSVTVREALDLASQPGNILIDVREPSEYASGHAAIAVSYPLSTINKESIQDKQLDHYKQIYVICQSGNRSSRATQLLNSLGLPAINVSGGTSAWLASGLPSRTD